MPQHPRVNIGQVKQWSRSEPRPDVEDIEALLLVLVTVDVALVRHGRTDLARLLRKHVARIIDNS